MITLPIPLEKVGFVEREKSNGKAVKNRCGRDFLYYALHYCLPAVFHPSGINPIRIETERLFGIRLPSWLMWTQLQFIYLPNYLKRYDLQLSINSRAISTFFDLASALLFSRISYEEAIVKIEDAIDNGKPVGVDVALKYLGLLDHVMFVYGYDSEFFYILDSHQVPILEYSKVSEDGNEYFMRLPKEIVRKRWMLFSRVWELKRIVSN